mgnify:CR=1 FL=1
MSNSQLSVLIQRQAEKYGDRVALKYRDYDTETWVPVSWKQFAETVTTTSNALLELGVGVQENIGVFSQNKPECLYVDFGAFGIRAVTIPFYATSSEAQVLYMLGDADIHYLFVGEQLQYDVAFRVMSLGTQLKQIIIFDKDVKRDKRDTSSIYFDEFLKLGKARQHQAEVDKRIAESGNGDIANILYTSGTTGDSKGVMLHHSCYEGAIKAHNERFPQLGDQEVVMNFLPFTHVFERAWSYWCISMGCQLAINLRPVDIQKTIKEIRSDLIYEIAFIESALDDPEHISLEGYPQKLHGIVEKEQKSIEELLKTSTDGKIIREGIETVIVGKPNAGKSSLLNLLVGENKAIVTDIEGTTRDILEEYITLHGITLKIVDTAGIRETEDVVEKIGVSRAREVAKGADLVLYVVDSSTPLDENDEEIIEMLKDRKAIVLYNKTDLVSAVSMEALKEKINHPLIPISAKEETGIAQLADTIKSMFFSGKISFNDEVYITNARHKEALEEAADSLAMVKQSIEDGMPEDFFSIDLMAAYGSLGKITGEEVGEDLVNEIFSKFCMGK